MFEFNTAVPAAKKTGLVGLMLQRAMLGCEWSKHFITGGRYWATLCVPGGMTVCMFSVGDDVGCGWIWPDKTK